MNMAGWVLLSGALGISTGIFFGEYCAVFKPVGAAYVMLLQSVVYPYIICSLLKGLGQLTPKTASRLFTRSWFFYLASWALVFVCLAIIGLAIPNGPLPSVLEGADSATARDQFLSLIIPANIFSDIVTNKVPAVVVFSILMGVALQHTSDKKEFLNILDIIKRASVTIWNWVVKLAPLAVFAMFAETAGTINLSSAGSLAIYLVLFLSGTLFLAFVTLPWAISALSHLSYGRVLRELKDGLLLAAVTTLSVAALPYIMRGVRRLMEDQGIDKSEGENIASSNLALSYPLGQLGNFFVLFFILFALYFFQAPASWVKQILLYPLTLLSCVGSPTSTVNAVAFLSTWLHLPPAASQLYVETMTVTRYGQVLLSVTGFGFLTFMCTLAYFGKLKVNFKKLFHCLFATVLFFSIVAGVAYLVEQGRADTGQIHYTTFTLDPEVTRNISAVVHKDVSPLEALAENETPMQRIMRTGVLRVGYNPILIPFSYFNDKGQLVGFDVANAYSLARGLNVRLEFVPVDFKFFLEILKQGKIDILMCGMAVSGNRLMDAAYSDAYYYNELVLIVRTDKAGDFLVVEDIRDMENLTMAAPRTSVLWEFSYRLFPKVKVLTIEAFDEFAARPEIDAVLWGRDQAAAWVNGHPGFTAVKPDGLDSIMLYGWLMPPDADDLRLFVNQWLALKKADGFFEAQAKIWFEGQFPPNNQPRWSVLKNILN
jgi:Na+/H+-dicarboxylate symporter